MRTARAVISTLFLGSACVGATAQDAPRALGCDTTAIRWFKPGEFDKARKLARGSKRLILVKGISFGVDDVGAKCATKGKW